jgi:hypothetical protein
MPPHSDTPAPPPVEEDWTNQISRRASMGVLLGAAAALPPGTSLAMPAANAAPSHAKLRHAVMADRDYGISAGQSAAANSAALQRAVDEAQVVVLPSSTEQIRLAMPVTVPPGTSITGAGVDRTQLVAEGAQAFVYQAPNGTEMPQGPSFADLSIRCAMGGIKLNEAGRGFTDTRATQQYILAPRLDRVRLSGPGARVAGSRGVEWNKVFHGIIDQCDISGFEVGIKTLGCDLCEARGRSRIWLCGTLLQIESSGYFGSSFKVDGCDLLLPARTFLKTSDRHLLFLNNYLENQTAAMSGPVLDLDFNYIMIFQNNRIEVPAAQAPLLLRLRGEGLLFVFENCGTLGPPWGAVEWNGDKSARYHHNSVHRQRIVARNNSPVLRVPFATVEPDVPHNGFRDLWIITPATGGFASSYNYADTCRVRDGAFILPALPRMGSLVRFRDAGNPAAGRINIHVRAKASVLGQELAIAQIEGGRYAAHVLLPLTLESRWHTAFSNIAVTDLAIDAYNDDTVHGGDACIEAVVVERAP